MKTICLCNSNIAWGGGEKWHLEAALALAGRGWRVLLLCHPKGALFARAPKDVPGLEVIPVPLGRLSFLNPFMRKRLRDIFRKARPRAVLLNMSTDLKSAGPAARAAGIPKIIFRRGLAEPVRDSALNRHLYGEVITHLIANSEATLNMVLANNSNLIPRERVTVLYNGMDAGVFDKALADAAAQLTEGGGGQTTDDGGKEVPGDGDSPASILRGLAAARLAGRERPLVIGTAGRFTAQKAQHLLLHVGKHLLDKGEDIRLVLSGEGELKAELTSLADSLGIADKVIFTGFMADLSTFWHAIDIFVLPSLWEGFGFVLLEAMLAEKPLLVFRVSNMPEIVIDGMNGYLFPLPEGEREPGGAVGEAASVKEGQSPFPENMAQKILELAADEDLRQRLGSAGRNFALAGFSQDACMDTLESLL